MKLLSTLFMIFSLCNSFAQADRKVAITYTVFFAEDDLPPNVYSHRINQKNGEIKFKLFINDSISFFLEDNGLSSSNLITKIVLAKAKYSNPIYCSNNEFLFNNNENFIFFEKNEYLISKKSIDNWKITDESKIIDGQLCYKATATDYQYTVEGKTAFPIEAWFCPSLPYNFGPLYYNNLPGLIMEISYLSNKLLATKIEYGFDEKKIVKPKGEKSIQFDDYNLKEEQVLSEVEKEYNRR